MAPEKKIVFVGGSVVSSDDTVNLGFRSDKSLLDGDLIVFSIDLSDYYGYEQFQGMRCLDDDSSFRLRKDCRHWRAELESALKDGKTVVVFVNSSPEVKAATGETQYAGTGRNARATRIVSTVDPYEAIPIAFGTVVRRSGERIKPVQDLGILATYWNEFGKHSSFEAYIDGFKGTPMLETQTGGKVVGGICRHSTWKGSLVFIPRPDLESAVKARLADFKAKQKGKLAKAAEGDRGQADRLRRKAESSVASQFIAALIGLDKAARKASESTPPPLWSLKAASSLQRRGKYDRQLMKTLDYLPSCKKSALAWS